MKQQYLPLQITVTHWIMAVILITLGIIQAQTNMVDHSPRGEFDSADPASTQAPSSDSTNSTERYTIDQTSGDTGKVNLEKLAAVRKFIREDPTLSTDAKHLNVVLTNNTVMIEGKVDSGKERDHVLYRVRDIVGMSNVWDRIQVQ